MTELYSPINYYSARSLMSVFDACYKMGVSDAIYISDIAICKEFCEKMYAPQKFGRIINDYEYSWREWKFRLTQLLYEGKKNTKYPKMGLKFFDCIGSYSGYLAPVLPVAMDFYINGIKDYCNYPNNSNWILFEQKPYMLWGCKITKVSMSYFVRKVVEFCYDREKIDKIAIEDREQLRLKNKDSIKSGRKPNGYSRPIPPVGLTESAYINFHKEIWRHTRVKSYNTIKKQ